MVSEPPSRYPRRVSPLWVKSLKHRPPFIPQNPKGNGARQKLGLRYERKVHQRLSDRFGIGYIPSPWFAYGLSSGEVKYCQPDGILLFDQRWICLCIEVKYTHTSDAYWQLENCYVPVLSAFVGRGWKIATCEVVKWYDPSIQFPRKLVLKEDLMDVRPGEFAVHILNRPDET